MSKVKLTKEQSNAIENLKETGFSFGTYLDLKVRSCFEKNKNRCLNSLKHEDFARAWIEGYEVEPQFKEGDVVFNDTPAEQSLFKVITSNKDGVCLISESGNKIFAGNKRIRHATELEKKFFELGRTEPKLKYGDVIETDWNCFYSVKALTELSKDTLSLNEAIRYFQQDKIVSIHPIEQRIEVERSD